MGPHSLSVCRTEYVFTLPSLLNNGGQVFVLNTWKVPFLASIISHHVLFSHSFEHFLNLPIRIFKNPSVKIKQICLAFGALPLSPGCLSELWELRQRGSCGQADVVSKQSSAPCHTDPGQGNSPSSFSTCYDLSRRVHVRTEWQYVPRKYSL